MSLWTVKKARFTVLHKREIQNRVLINGRQMTGDFYRGDFGKFSDIQKVNMWRVDDISQSGTTAKRLTRNHVVVSKLHKNCFSDWLMLTKNLSIVKRKNIICDDTEKRITIRWWKKRVRRNGVEKEKSKKEENDREISKLRMGKRKKEGIEKEKSGL